jgi:hypothetical protein
MHATKIWRVVKQLQNKHTPYNRLEELWSCSAPFGKNNIGIETNLSWTKPKCITPKETTVALVQYNKSSNTVSFPSVLSLANALHANNIPQPIEDYQVFALNPAHQFSPVQARSLYLQLCPRISAQQTTQFLQLYPNADKEEIANENQSFQTYPSTLSEACQLFQALAPIATNNQGQPQQIAELPTLFFVPSPPYNAPYVVPNLRAVNAKTGHTLRPRAYSVSLHITPQGKHCARREVFYANEIPISPLKSTVAILYYDTNPNSPTSGQPIIKSINTGKANPEEVATFLAEHRSVMTTEQLAQFEPQPLQSRQLTSSNPTGEFPMPLPIQNCVECEAEFVPARITSRFCCEPCRVTYYSKGRRKGSANPQQPATTSLQPAPANAVTQEQFQALSAQVAQLVQILTPKQS